MRYLLMVLIGFVCSNVMADKYNFDFCDGCDSGDISDYFNRYAGASPVYRGDIYKGTIKGYERYTIQEPGYPNWYGVRQITVPNELRASFDKVLVEYIKLTDFFNKSTYDRETGEMVIEYIPKNSIPNYTEKKTLNNALDNASAVSVTIPSEIANSAWNLSSNPSVQRQIINYAINKTFSSYPQKSVPFAAAASQAITLSQVNIKIPEAKITVNLGEWSISEGAWVYKGQVRISVFVADMNGNLDGAIDWTGVRDEAGNSIPKNMNFVSKTDMYMGTKSNIIDMTNALKMMGFDTRWEPSSMFLPVPLTCAANFICQRGGLED